MRNSLFGPIGSMITALTIFLLCITTSATAQTPHTVKGQVTNNKGEPLEGVTVTVKNTTTGTSTDATGNYTLQVTDPQSTLVFSIVGYASRELPVNAQATLNV